MKWLRALWKAILAFFQSINSGTAQEQQQIQDEMVQETQHEIEEVPTKTDDELLDIGIDTGLVSAEDPDRSSGSKSGTANPYTRIGTSFKAKH